MDELIEKLNSKEFSRQLQIDTSTLNEEERTVELSVSSEYPVRQNFGYEILDHKPESIRWQRLKSGAAVRDTHTGDQIGIIEKAWIDPETKKMRNLIRFSKNTQRAEEVYKDVKDKIRKNVSIKYEIHNAIIEREEKGVKVFRVIDWEPIHVSMEPDGADPTVGVTRDININIDNKPVIEEKQSEQLNNELIEKRDNETIEQLNNKITELDNKIKIINIKGERIKMDEEKKLQEEARVKSIDALAEKFSDKVKGLKETADLYKATFRSEKDFADFIFENQKQQAAIDKPVVELSAKEKAVYSPANAVRSLLSGANCLERELSNEFAKQIGQSPAGIYLLHDAVLPKMRTGKRDLTAGTQYAAAELVGVDHLGSMLIDYLYEKMVLDNVTFMPNRKGNVEIPVLSASAGYGWAATEVTAVAEGSPTTTEKTASPKRGGRFIEMTKQLMIQSDPDAEALFTNDLLKSLAIGIQNAILNGTGANGQPTGLKLTSGIGAVGSVASMDWDKAVQFETEIDDAFGDGNGMYFVTRRAHAGALKTRKIDEGSGRFINEGNVVNGYGVRTTNLVASGDVFFGDWTNIIVPLWGAVDLVFDPYTKAAEGMVKITANQLLDVIVRYPSAFSYGSSFS